MLLLVTLLKLIAEIALLALAGQWLLGLLAGAARERNLFYRLLAVIAAPVVWLARRVMPRGVADRQLPLAAFAVLGVVWLVLTATKIGLCLQLGVAACR